MQLPGYTYRGTNPDIFAPRNEVIRFIEDCAELIRAPVRCDVNVVSLTKKPGSRRFEVQTNDDTFDAANVVIATGPNQQPLTPQRIENALLGTIQVNSSRYCNPDQLPLGAVLVIQEYAHVPDALWVHGRRVVLARFLNRERILQTAYFRMRPETAARANLQSECDQLSSA
jgi:putative flavoprotein involved in K+ transport